MVNDLFAPMLLLAEQATEAQTALERMDPERRAAVVLALVGLALLGVLLVVMTMLAGRWARQERPRRPIRSSGTSRSAETTAAGGDTRTIKGGNHRGETLAEGPGDADTVT